MVTWPRTLPDWPPGGAKDFFRIRSSRQPLVLSPTFFQGRVPPEAHYLSSGGHGVGGQIWVSDPQKWIFFYFFCGTSPWAGGENCRMEIIVTGDPFDAWNLKKNSSIFFEKIEFKVFGGGALCRVHPLGGLLSPAWPLQILVLGTLIKKVLFGGNRPPFGGDIGFGRFALWPTFSRNLLDRFWNF